MGGDIAAWCALRGLNVTLQDRELKYIEPALTRARALFEKRLPTPAERMQPRRQRLRADVAGSGVAQGGRRHRSHLRGPGGQARAVCRGRAAHAARMRVLASNTSSLTLEIARRRRWQGPGPPGRPALLQSGAADAAGGSGAFRGARARKCWRPRWPSLAASTSCRCPAAAARASWSTACCFPTCTRHCMPLAKASRSTPSIAQRSTSACRWDRSSCPMWWVWTSCCTWEKSSPASCSANLRRSQAACAQLVQARSARSQERPGLLSLARWQDRARVRSHAAFQPIWPTG